MKLNIGDKVRLKSGGPEMTVEDVVFVDVGDAVRRQAAACCWFYNGDIKRGRFYTPTLVKARQTKNE